MKMQLSKRLGVAHVRDTVMQLVAGEIEFAQAMAELQVGCRLYARECVPSYLDMFCGAFSRYGLPLEIYVDKAGFFRGENGELTQLGRRLKFFDISFVFANSPESKGKIERVHLVWPAGWLFATHFQQRSPISHNCKFANPEMAQSFPLLLSTKIPLLKSTRQLAQNAGI